MRIALLQIEVVLGDASANRQKVEKLVKQASETGVDTIVLPETWNLGFFPRENLLDLAEWQGGESRKLLSWLAAKYRVNLIGGSIITRKQDGIYNTAYVMDRSGAQVAEYDKIHCFSPSQEHMYFQHGSRICTFQLDGVTAGLIICYDLRFCELVRTAALQGVQILFVPAQWPDPRLEHWQVLNRARAIENQIYVACVNGCGRADQLQFCGHSMLIDPFGEVLVECSRQEEIAYGQADFDKITDIRNNINVFRDRRPELYYFD